MTFQSSSEYLKVAEAARLLGVTHRWVYRRVLSGELPASKVGGLYFIHRKDLQTLMETGRVDPDKEAEIEPEKSLPGLKCSACFRLLKDESEIGGGCEVDSCGEFICQRCWDQNVRTCMRHSPNREQRLQKALAQKQAGELRVVVQAGAARISEISFLNSVHAHLSGFSTLIHPGSGLPLTVPSWDAILESGDERSELMHLLGKVVLDSQTVAQQPLNAWHHYAIKNKNTASLEIFIQVISRMNKMVRDGFDSQALSADVLYDWINRSVETPDENAGNFRLVLLASSTGWDDSARAAITGENSFPFTHRLALLYLFDMERSDLVYNTNDDRLHRYSELFTLALGGKELIEIIQQVKNLMGVHDSLTLEEAQKTLPFYPEKIKCAFEKMAMSEEFMLIELKGLGSTIVKRQAL